jgi:hypothetical protein
LNLLNLINIKISLFHFCHSRNLFIIVQRKHEETAQVEESVEKDQEHRLEELEALVQNTNSQPSSQQRSTEPMASQKKKEVSSSSQRMSHFKTK